MLRGARIVVWIFCFLTTSINAYERRIAPGDSYGKYAEEITEKIRRANNGRELIAGDFAIIPFDSPSQVAAKMESVENARMKLEVRVKELESQLTIVRKDANQLEHERGVVQAEQKKLQEHYTAAEEKARAYDRTWAVLIWVILGAGVATIACAVLFFYARRVTCQLVVALSEIKMWGARTARYRKRYGRLVLFLQSIVGAQEMEEYMRFFARLKKLHEKDPEHADRKVQEFLYHKSEDYRSKRNLLSAVARIGEKSKV